MYVQVKPAMPVAPSVAWWHRYELGYQDGLKDRYRPANEIAASSGYDRGHYDGAMTRRQEWRK